MACMRFAVLLQNSIFRGILAFLGFSLLLIFAGCGGNPNTDSAGTGSLALSINWQAVPSAMAHLATPLNCTAAGVSTVEAQVFNSGNVVMATGGPWQCSAHTGSLSVPAGANYSVVVYGKDTSGNVNYRGQQDNVSIAAGISSSASVTAATFSPQLANPSDGATVTTGSYSLDWLDQGTGISYRVQVANNNAFNPTVINAISTTATYDPGVLAADTYYWRVQSIDAFGSASGWSSGRSFIVSSSSGTNTNTGSAPSAPTGVSTTSGNGSATLTWNAVTGATSYNVYWSTTTGVTTANGTKITGATSPYAHSGLTNGTTYYYIVTAVNSYGESTPSTQVSAAPVGTGSVPAAPTGLTATPGNGQVSLTWNTVTGATSYYLYHSESSNITTANGYKVGTYYSGSALFSGVNGVTEYFIVTAVNSYGESAASAIVSATPAAAPSVPTAPTGVTATAGSGQVSVSWSSVVGATSYNVYWSTTNGVTPANGAKLTGAANPAVLTGLTNGTTYYFVVTAVNIAGESSASTQVSATPSAVSSVTTLASGLSSAMGIAVDASNVYWTDAVKGQVNTVAISGGTVTTLTTGGGEPWAVAVDSSSLYWTDASAGQINKIGKTGGAVTPLATGVNPYGIVVDSSNVYWIEGTATAGSGHVKKVSINGGTVTTLASGMSSQYSSVQAIAIDSSSVYWVDQQGGTVNKVDKNGGSVTVLASGLSLPYSIAVDSTSVYWTENGQNGAVKKVGINGGSVTTLATRSWPNAIALDASAGNLYWAETSSIVKIVVSGGTVTTVAQSASANSLVVDSTSLYWAYANLVQKTTK
jgi:hypothetical protein